MEHRRGIERVLCRTGENPEPEPAGVNNIAKDPQCWFMGDLAGGENMGQKYGDANYPN